MVPRFKPFLGWREFALLFKRNKGSVTRFEQDFAKKFQAVDAVAFPYGRSAQWAFLKALGVEGKEVIMPAYTCSVVAHAVSLSGNHPRFIDINLEDFNMNLDLVENAVSEKTLAIIATHTFGYPQDLDRLEEIVKKAEARFGRKVWLIQDCCHAFGAKWKGRMVGTSGDVAVYAFNISKIITSIFGGMLTFRDQSLADKVRAWRDQHFNKGGIWRNLMRRLYLLGVYLAFNNHIYGFTLWLQEKTPFLFRLTKSYHLDEKIHFPPDYLSQMTDVEAAVGLEQLNKYPEIIHGRQKKAKWYDANLERRSGWVFPPIVEGATYSHYVVRVPERESIVREYKKRGVQLGELIDYSIPDISCYKDASPKCHLSSEASRQTINFSVSS